MHILERTNAAENEPHKQTCTHALGVNYAACKLRVGLGEAAHERSITTVPVHARMRKRAGARLVGMSARMQARRIYGASLGHGSVRKGRKCALARLRARAYTASTSS